MSQQLSKDTTGRPTLSTFLSARRGATAVAAPGSGCSVGRQTAPGDVGVVTHGPRGSMKILAFEAAAGPHRSRCPDCGKWVVAHVSAVMRSSGKLYRKVHQFCRACRRVLEYIIEKVIEATKFFSLEIVRGTVSLTIAGHTFTAMLSLGFSNA